MTNKVRIVIEVEADNGVKGTLTFDSRDNKISVVGEVYPWVIRSLLDLIDKKRDIIKRPEKGE